MKKNAKFPIGPILIFILISFFLFLTACSSDEITAHVVVESGQADANLADTLALGLADSDVKEVVEEVPETIALEPAKPKIEQEIKEIIKEKPKEKVEVVLTVKDEDDIEKIAKIIEDSSGEVTGEFKVGDVISAEIEAEKLEEISEEESIEEIALEKEYVAFLEESIPQMKIDSVAWANNYTGKGIKIAILDTGIETGHSMFKDRILLSKSFNNEGVDDLNGHGTHVAGIAAGNSKYKGAAPAAYLLNAKVLNKYGSGKTSQIIAGINWALDPDDDESTDDGADIISMSFGGTLTDLDGPLASAIKDAIKQGVVFVAASGNCKKGCGGFFGVTMPGSMEEVITVGAVDEKNKAASFSSGDTFNNYVKPDVVAPGVNIMSATINSAYTSASGTSMSTPMISGVIALMLEKESLSHSKIKEKLESTAIDSGDAGKDINYGSGLVNVSALFGVEEIEINTTINETEEINKTYEGYWVTVDVSPEDKENITCPENYSGYDPGLGLTRQEFFFLFEDCMIEEDSAHTAVEKMVQVDGQNFSTADFDMPAQVRIKMRNNSKTYIPNSTDDEPSFDKEELLAKIDISSYTPPTKPEPTNDSNLSQQALDIEVYYDDDYTYSAGDGSDGVAWGGSDLDVYIDGSFWTGYEVVCYDWCGDGKYDHCFADSNTDFSKCEKESSTLKSYCNAGKCKTGVDVEDDHAIGTGDPGDRWKCEVYAKYYGHCQSSIYSYDLDYDSWPYYVVSPRQYVCSDSNTYDDFAQYSDDWGVVLDTVDCASDESCDYSRDESKADFGDDGDSKPSSPCRLKDGEGDCDYDSDCLTGSHCSEVFGTDYCCPSGEEWLGSKCGKECTAQYTGNLRCNGDTIQKEYQNKDCSTEWHDGSTCSGTKKCSNGQCVEKTCSDYGQLYGACSTEYSKKRQGNDILECKDQILIGQKFCWEKISSLGDSDFCSQLTTFSQTCGYGEYDCDANKGQCGTNLYCVGSWTGDKGCCKSGESWNTNSHTCYCPDNDGDGHSIKACGGDDCDDSDSARYPGKSEVCDKKDNDCDGSVDESGVCDCHLSSVSWDKTSAGMSSSVGFKVYGNSNCNGKSTSIAVWEADWSSADDPVNNNPSSITLSNGVGSGTWNAEWQYDAGTNPEYYLIASQGSSSVTSGNQLTVTCSDVDGDGYSNWVCGGSDCDDANPHTHPGRTESCDGLDNDCNGQVDEIFNFQTDNNHCGACHMSCSAIGQYYQCQNYVCVRQRVCGDNICEGPETNSNCPQDCYGDLRVTKISAPSEVDQNDYVTITATVENKGTYIDKLNIEAGIVPDYWRGTVFSQNGSFSIQTVGSTTKCCLGNAYYAAKTISLGAGKSEDVTFNVYAPKTTTIDACGTPSSGYYSAWDTSHEVMAGIYPACGQSYTHSLTKDIKVKETPCNFDSDCGPGATCHYDADHPSQSACIPNPCESQCDSGQLYFCEGQSLYMCKMNLTNGCYQKKPLQTCSVGYECVSGKSSCQKIVIQTQLSIEESTGAVVYKQIGDIVTVKLKHNKNENIQLEYDHNDFTLDKSSCPGDSFMITKDMDCKFTVGDSAWGEYDFKLKNGNKRSVDIIYYPDLLILTNKKKLLERFSGDKTGVNDLLAKAYAQADSSDRQGIIYDLDDYIADHPWEKLSDYKETPRKQVMTDNSYSMDVGQFVRDKCEACEGVVILGDDFVVPYYRRDVSILEWKLFYSDTRIDNIYSDIPYIKRTEKYFSELDDLFKFKGKYNNKKVKLLLPDSVSSDMDSEITEFKNVITKRYSPKIHKINSSDVYCKDQKLFEKYDSATLIVIGTEKNNRAYQCMPFVAGYENRDSAFIDINPWDGREYSIIINTDDPHVLEALTETIDSGAYVKLKSKNWWYLEIGLTAVSYVFLLGEAITGIPLDTASDVIDSVNDCWIIGDSLSCKVSVPMIAIPWIPGKPFKVAFKAFRKSVGKPVEMFLTKYGDEAFKFLKMLYKKGELDKIQDMFRLAGDKWDEAYQLLKTELGDKILLKWSGKAREGLGKVVQKLNKGDIEKLAKEYGDDSVAAVSERYARETVDWSKDKITKTIKMKGTGNLVVEDNNLVAFQYWKDEFLGSTNYKVGKIYDFDNTEYFFKPNKVFQPDNIRDQTFSNLREKAIYNVESVLNAKDAKYIVPETKITREVGIGLPTGDPKKVKGLLLESVDGKTFEDGFQKWRASKGISNLDYADYLAASDGLSKSTKEAMYGKTFSDMVFGEMDRHPRNILVAADGKVSYIDYGGSLGLDKANNPIFLKDASFETVFKDADFTDMDTRPIAGSLAKMWKRGDEGKKDVLKLMKPEVDKFRTFTRDQFETATMFEDMVKADRDKFRIITDKLFGKGSSKGRVQGFIDDFDNLAKQYGVN